MGHTGAAVSLPVSECLFILPAGGSGASGGVFSYWGVSIVVDCGGFCECVCGFVWHCNIRPEYRLAVCWQCHRSHQESRLSVVFSFAAFYLKTGWKQQEKRSGPYAQSAIYKKPVSVRTAHNVTPLNPSDKIAFSCMTHVIEKVRKCCCSISEIWRRDFVHEIKQTCWTISLGWIRTRVCKSKTSLQMKILMFPDILNHADWFNTTSGYLSLSLSASRPQQIGSHFNPCSCLDHRCASPHLSCARI